MSHLITAQRAILVKRETTYNTDPTPTGSANYVELYEPSDPSYESANVERAPARPTLGGLSTIVGNGPYKLEGWRPLAGSGDAETPPSMADLLLACAMDETVTADTDVTYTPLPTLDGTEGSITAYDNLGGVRHKGTGVRGTLQLEFAHEDIPKAKFSFTGNRANPADAAMPSVTVPTDAEPLPINKANTQFTIHGETPVLHNLSLDLGNEVVWKDYVNSTQEARVLDRKQITGTLAIEASLLATQDWYAVVRAGTLDELELVHGATAGNIVECGATEVQLLNPKPGDADGIQIITFDLLILSGFYLRFK
jgi:hypothetical protein